MKHPGKSFLSTSERSSLQALHRSKRDKRECDRIKSIVLLDNGWSFDRVATALLLDNDTIRRYCKTYTEGGTEALLAFHYSGKSPALNCAQLDNIRRYVRENAPSRALKIVAYVKEQFGVVYSESGMILLLHRLGFVYKKPKLVPGKADPLKQEQFLHELQEIEKELDEKDALVYMDGVHPQHNSKPAYGWFEKGKECSLKANSGRQRININGALNANNLEVVTVECDSVNAQSTIELFKKLEAQHLEAQRIVVVCDNARYYRSRLVSDYVGTSKIELKFLPPYAPNLNLIERLWRFMNKIVRNNRYYDKFAEFKKGILDFFDRIGSYRKPLKRLLIKKFHIINP